MPARENHGFYYSSFLMEDPIVPGFDRPALHDLDCYLTPVRRDELKMKSRQGVVWRALHHWDEIKRYITRQLEEVVIPADS